MLLRELVEKNRVGFYDRFDKWEDAIVAACKPLIDDGSIENAYVESIISSVKEHGPYIVFAPDIAMPHAQKGGIGVNRTAMSFMKVETPVRFSEDNRDKDARLFFTVCAVDEAVHLENMERLAELLMTSPDITKELLEVRNSEELLKLDKKYSK